MTKIYRTDFLLLFVKDKMVYTMRIWLYIVFLSVHFSRHSWTNCFDHLPIWSWTAFTKYVQIVKRDNKFNLFVFLYSKLRKKSWEEKVNTLNVRSTENKNWKEPKGIKFAWHKTVIIYTLWIRITSMIIIFMYFRLPSLFYHFPAVTRFECNSLIVRWKRIF